MIFSHYVSGSLLCVYWYMLCLSDVSSFKIDTNCCNIRGICFYLQGSRFRSLQLHAYLRVNGTPRLSPLLKLLRWWTKLYREISLTMGRVHHQGKGNWALMVSLQLRTVWCVFCFSSSAMVFRTTFSESTGMQMPGPFRLSSSYCPHRE